jgi:hypothetical protein
MIDLNDSIDPSSGWTLAEAHAINDAGQIVGSGFHNGAMRAYLITPIPEPFTLTLSGIGAAGLLAWAGVMRLHNRLSCTPNGLACARVSRHFAARKGAARSGE